MIFLANIILTVSLFICFFAMGYCVAIIRQLDTVKKVNKENGRRLHDEEYDETNARILQGRLEVTTEILAGLKRL